MLDSESKATEGLQDEDGEDLDLISQLADMSIKPESSSDAADGGDTLVMNNPVFKETRPSSKIETIVEELRKLKKKSQVWKKSLKLYFEAFSRLFHLTLTWGLILEKVYEAVITDPQDLRV